MIEIDNKLPGSAALAWFVLGDVSVAPATATVREQVDQTIADLRGLYATTAAASDALQPARRLYRALGLDPSKRRPASEALLRRIIQGKGLYRVNNAVDAANLCALRAMLPVGLYDLERVQTAGRAIVLRSGLPGEGYEGIGKGRIDAQGKPVLVDDLGPFGNPSADAARTRVDENSSRLLFVLYAPVDFPDLRGALGASAEIMSGLLGGTLTLPDQAR